VGNKRKEWVLRVKRPYGGVGIKVLDFGNLRLYVSDIACSTGGWYTPSGIRFKDNMGL
jgi:hypothetical protein